VSGKITYCNYRPDHPVNTPAADCNWNHFLWPGSIEFDHRPDDSFIARIDFDYAVASVSLIGSSVGGGGRD
jgi:hypothetical protein